MNDLPDYQKIKEDAQKFYNNIGSILSPALEERIIFSADGFNHIIFKDSHSEREKSSQVLRFKLISLAKKLVEISTTYQEFEESIHEFLVKRYKKKVKKNQVVRYWGIIAIMDGRKIKVIIRKVGDNGFVHFWSIIPAWSTNRYRDARFFTTMQGRPEED